MVKVFSVYDSKVKAWLMPFCFPSRGHAMRAFTNTVNGADSEISRYPEDFTLFEIGEFDEVSGKLSGAAVFEALGTALEYKTAEDRGLVKLNPPDIEHLRPESAC